MTTPVIGSNCDLMLVHPSIAGGDPAGFVLAPDPSQPTGTISVQREKSLDDQQIFLFFTLIMADDLINPDGSQNDTNRSVAYASLLNYLSLNSGISVVTHLGTFLGIGPLGHSATELHMVNGSYISVKLANVTAYRPPISAETFFACVWQDTVPADDALTWETSYWV